MLAGPFCSALLADVGAEVVKIEAPGGDDYRHIGPFKNGESALFMLINRGKKSVVVDLKSPAQLLYAGDTPVRTGNRHPLSSPFGSFEAGDGHVIIAVANHVRRALGGDFEHFVSGGAPLAYEVAEFFETVGTPVIQG